MVMAVGFKPDMASFSGIFDILGGCFYMQQFLDKAFIGLVLIFFFFEMVLRDD